MPTSQPATTGSRSRSFWKNEVTTNPTMVLHQVAIRMGRNTSVGSAAPSCAR